MITIADLQFRYPRGGFGLDVPALEIAAGQKAALIGPSGAGKTTLISLIAGVLAPHRGTIRLGDFELTRVGDAARRNFRIAQIGFVFQEFELLEYLNVRDNILLPYYLNATLRLTAAVRGRAEQLAGGMGLGDKLRRLPRTLSQGERQRVAICRALIAEPGLLIADEPTGNLDPHNADTILSLLLEQAQVHGATLLMVTHNHALLNRFDRVLDIATFTRRMSA